VSPEAGRKQRRRGHPDAELIAVLEKANRPKSDVAFRSQPAIGLEAVDMRIKLRAGDKARSGRSAHRGASRYKCLRRQQERGIVAEIQAAEQVRNTPGPEAGRACRAGLPQSALIQGMVCDSRTQGQGAPEHHRQIPPRQTEAAHGAWIEKEDSGQRRQACDGCLGDEYPAGRAVPRIQYGKGASVGTKLTVGSRAQPATKVNSTATRTG
jgi:hypothetical protein